MKEVARKNIRIPLWGIILISLISVLALSIILYIFETDPKIYSIIGGVSAGIIICIIQFLFSVFEYKKIDKFEELGVLEVLPDRRDGKYYRNIIAKAKDSIQVMGASCTRFIDDYANLESDDHILVDRLNKNSGLVVKILIPKEGCMDESSQLRFRSGEEKLRRFIEQFKGRVELRRHAFEARHGLVRVDDDLVVGPIFQGIESRDSPAIHLNTNSPYAEKYLKYFNLMWEGSEKYS